MHPRRSTTLSEQHAVTIPHILVESTIFIAYPGRSYSYTHIVHHYGILLQETQIASEPMPSSPPQAISTEPMFTMHFNTYIQSQLRCLAPQLANMPLTPVTVDIGDAATIIDNYRPDVAFFTADASPNRCPGDLKVSWKWETGYRTSQVPAERKEYMQVLSQVNYYMKQHHARYRYVLSDIELVPIKRVDENGNLLVAQAIPWEAKGPECVTVLLGLWYLGMLSAANYDWQLL
ncbi:hypothetical protein EMCG_01894 [[Emmonsia] crescens]|uniref:Fungal-type protein kinase domain-containing protein n=1 Tax=[Emmonsia] crescens TaxID=73230 RepID=A0A0G2I0X4_9EURO|nr:hypothetical protein EMCG_01894 [Emmonsia crescens UAMH 3008]